MKFTDYLKRNPVGGVTLEENYDEEYVIIILAERAELNLKYGHLFEDQSIRSKCITERTKNNSERKTEHKTDQSQLNRTFQNKKHVNETEKKTRKQHPGSPILAL